MSSGKTHYQVMGLPEDASADQIKKAFRKLAREYHPDLHRDRPEMHEVFVRISQAYDILSDPARRAAYDLDLRSQARRDAERRSGGFGSSPFAQASAAGSARASTGFGGGAGAASPRNDKARIEKEKKRQTVTKLMDDARLSYARGHLTEARRLCQEVLEVSRLGEAYLMLGDIAARQGRWNAAVDNYTLAMQMMPNDPRIRGKFEEAVARMGGSAGRGARGAGQRGALGSTVSPSNRISYQLGLACFGCAIILFLMFWAPNLRSARLDWPLVEDWTEAHFYSMLGVGFLAGAFLASAALVEPFRSELIVRSVGPGKTAIPVWLILAVAGAIFFPLAIAAYGLIAYLQQRPSPSIVGLLAVAVLLVLGFCVVTPQAWAQTLLLGGNVVFVSALVGWFIGDLFRPGWAAD